MQNSDKCIRKCHKETDRLKDVLDVSLPAWLYSEGSREQDRENTRCIAFCTEYIAQCASKAQRTMQDNLEVSNYHTTTEACKEAEKKWMNYLFVIRNRPTKLSFPARDRPQKPQDFKPDKTKSKEEITEELQEKYLKVTGQSEAIPRHEGHLSVEEFMMRKQ